MSSFERYLFPVILSLCLFSAGCEKVIEPKDLPDQDPMIVVNSILSSGSAMSATVSSSKSILSGKDFRMIENAGCEVYEDGNFLERLDGGKLGVYQGTVVPKAGHRYTVKVRASGFKDAEGSTQLVPEVSAVKVELLDTSSSFQKSYMNGDFMSFGGSLGYRVTLEDDINARNFYEFRVKVWLYDSLNNLLTLQFYASVYAQNPPPGVFQSGNALQFSDEGTVTGREIRQDIQVSCYSSDLVADQAKRIEVELEVASLSEDLYKYMVTAGQQAIMSGQLFAEPVLVHNNVQNGMGIIGGRTLKTFPLYKGVIRTMSF